MPVTLTSIGICAPMLYTLAFASLLCLASCARHSSSLQAKSHTVGKEFDYFLLVRQWPGNYCSKNSCPLIRDRGFHFTIHGLWPNYDDGTWPQFCDPNYKFDESQLDDLMDDLEGEWPSAYDSDETFWEHEWSKHGTCALRVFPTEHSYFSNVLKLHWRYDLAATLRKASILPEKHKEYRAKDLEDAVYDEYGVRPVVRCEDNALSEIWMCLGKDLRPFSCDREHGNSTCGKGKLTIPPLRVPLPGVEEEEEEENYGVAALAGSEQQPGRSGQESGVQLAAGGGSAGSVRQPAATLDAAPQASSALGTEVGDGAVAVSQPGAILAGSDSGAAGALVADSASHGSGSAIVEDSIYWLLKSEGAAPMKTSSSTDGDPAAAAAADAVAVVVTAGGVITSRDITPAVDGSETSAGSGEPNDDTSSFEEDQPASAILELASRQFELHSIEQRLKERAAEAADVALREATTAAARGGAAAADASGAGALAALAALVSRLQQRLMWVGGDLVNDDLAEAGGELEPVPNGGAAAAASRGAQDFVWASKLRNGNQVAFSADEAEERASLLDDDASGAAAAAALAVMTRDGDSGPIALWAVQRVLVLPAGDVGVGVRPAASAPPMWVVLLLAVQLICVVVITLSLVVMTCMALVGARWGLQRQLSSSGGQLEDEEAAAAEAEAGCCGQPEHRGGSDDGAQCWPEAAELCGAGARGQGELEEPLLWPYDEGAEEPPKVCCANRDKSAAEEEEEEEREAEQRRLLLRQQRQDWHVNPLQQAGPGPESVWVLPATAGAGVWSSTASLPPYASMT